MIIKSVKKAQSRFKNTQESLNLISNILLFYFCLHIKVQDGIDGDLGEFCGNKLPDPVIALSGTLIVKFHSDGSVQKTGFSAVYEDNYGIKSTLDVFYSELNILIFILNTRAYIYFGSLAIL